MTESKKRRKRIRNAEEVRALLYQCTADAIEVLYGIMKNTELKPDLRMKAAETVLDRVCGKVTASASSAQAENEVPGILRFEGVLDEWSR